MDLNDFVQKVAMQFEETDAEVFSPETDFRQLEEWSSLLALTLIAMVDEEYGVKIKGDDIRSSDTIEDLYNIVQSNL